MKNKIVLPNLFGNGSNRLKKCRDRVPTSLCGGLSTDLSHYHLFVIFCLSLLICGCVKGSEALTVMNDQEHKYVDNVLSKINKGMTITQVSELLNTLEIEYYKKASLYYWYPEIHKGKSQVRLYFSQDKIFNVRWMKLGKNSFVYEPFDIK